MPSMISPARARAGTASPASRASRDENTYPRRGNNSPYRHSPHRSSPSVHIAEEFAQLNITKERIFQKQQDAIDAEQKRLHEEALAKANAEHERVRLDAQRTAELDELKKEREQKRREEEGLRALEQERREKAEREAEERRRMKEDLARQEEEQKRRAAEEKEIHEAQARLAEQKRKAEAEAARRQKEQEEADRKAKEEAAAAAASAAAQPAQPTRAPQTAQASQAVQNAPAPTVHGHPQPTPQSTAPPAVPPTVQSQVQSTPATVAAPNSPTAQREALHKQYLIIHKRLKTMRTEVTSKCKQIPELKKRVGDWRREINTKIGQCAVGQREGNNQGIRDVLRVLMEAAQFPGQPAVNVAPLMVSVPDDSELPMPGVLVYLLNIVSKKVVLQWVAELAKAADPVAVVGATVFSKPEFSINGTSLIDILLAKMHRCCPVLFGICGDEKTTAGKLRLGWWAVDGALIEQSRHEERMIGLATGYACLSLRDFSKSRNSNPFPPSNYWKTLSYIVNTPSAEIQPTQFIVLKALIDGGLERFLGFYGQAGLVALKYALVELPKGAPPTAAKDLITVMPQTLERDMHLTLL